MPNTFSKVSAALVPTFRSSCSIAAPTFTNFGKSWALANTLILVPLYRSEVPDRIRRLWCRDFRSAVLALALACLTSTSSLASDRLYFHGDREPVVAVRGNARALGRLGFRYENGFGVPQNYAAAAALYLRAAERGDPFAQCRLGLSYDRGHGVPKDVILSYKWLDLATARASRRERGFYQQLRDAVAQKMSLEQVTEGQRLALVWAAGWADPY